MHHSSGPGDKMQSLMEAMIKDASAGASVGPTGNFPQGKLTPSDEGELRLSVGSKDGKVVLHFGTAVTWIGFDGAQAMELGLMLIEKARDVG